VVGWALQAALCGFLTDRSAYPPQCRASNAETLSRVRFTRGLYALTGRIRRMPSLSTRYQLKLSRISLVVV
jgi:hypothetical protein